MPFCAYVIMLQPIPTAIFAQLKAGVHHVDRPIWPAILLPIESEAEFYQICTDGGPLIQEVLPTSRVAQGFQ